MTWTGLTLLFSWGWDENGGVPPYAQHPGRADGEDRGVPATEQVFAIPTLETHCAPWDGNNLQKAASSF